MDFLGDTAGVQIDPRCVASNQATLRTLNEGINIEPADGVIAFRCECGQLGCNRLIPLRRAQYEAVRLNARRFVVAPGHAVAELEHEVERHGEHAVVETHPHTLGVRRADRPSQRGHRLRIRGVGWTIRRVGASARRDRDGVFGGMSTC